MDVPKVVVAGITASLLLVAGVAIRPASMASAAAEQDECVHRLFEAPIEDAVLPEGWRWSGTWLGDYYWRSSPNPATLVGLMERSHEDESDQVWLWLRCVPEADAVLRRMVDSRVASGAVERPVAPVGDGSVAFSGDDEAMLPFWTAPSILWRDGDVLGRVVWLEDTGLPDLRGPSGAPAPTPLDTLADPVAIARSVSDVLIAAGLTGPVASEDACVRRLVEAPVEEYLGPYGPSLVVFETATPAWADSGVMVGDGLILSCQPEAARLVERWAELERSDGVDVGTLGDGAIALGWSESGRSRHGTIVWSSGDVLGEIRDFRGELADATGMARGLTQLVVEDGLAPRMSLTADERACVRRLLDAPLETIRAFSDEREGDPWSYFGLGADHIAPRWDAQPRFELACQPAAPSIMDRAAQLARGKVRVLGSVGDAAIAIGTRRDPAMWWRDGDVLGWAEGDTLQRLVRLARRVGGMLE